MDQDSGLKAYEQQRLTLSWDRQCETEHCVDAEHCNEAEYCNEDENWIKASSLKRNSHMVFEWCSSLLLNDKYI